MAKLAFMTLGILRAPIGDKAVQGFFDRIPAVFESADANEGLTARSRRDSEWQHSWGQVVAPKCYSNEDPNRIVATLSLWEGLEELATFAYYGPHREALSHGAEWTLRDGRPTHVGWWVEDGRTPTFAEGADRLDHLHEKGPTDFAFKFGALFDNSGNAVRLDAARVKNLATKLPVAGK